VLPRNYSCATPVALCFPESDRAIWFGRLLTANVSEGPGAKPPVGGPTASLPQPPAGHFNGGRRTWGGCGRLYFGTIFPKSVGLGLQAGMGPHCLFASRRPMPRYTARMLGPGRAVGFIVAGGFAILMAASSSCQARNRHKRAAPFWIISLLRPRRDGAGRPHAGRVNIPEGGCKCEW
jgi:hypothetical protein